MKLNNSDIHAPMHVITLCVTMQYISNKICYAYFHGFHQWTTGLFTTSCTNCYDIRGWELFHVLALPLHPDPTRAITHDALNCKWWSIVMFSSNHITSILPMTTNKTKITATINSNNQRIERKPFQYDSNLWSPCWTVYSRSKCLHKLQSWGHSTHLKLNFILHTFKSNLKHHIQETRTLILSLEIIYILKFG